MPRKKKLDAPTTTEVAIAPQAGLPRPEDTVKELTFEPDAAPQRQWARTFRSTLSLPGKGVTIGVRDGHDWVIGFPEDPGSATKQRLSEAGLSYRQRDRKWVIFTHAPNRAGVERLAKELKAEFGDKMSVNDYPVKQLVMAFESSPGDEVTAALKENGFFYRNDRTWNAEFTPQAQDFARELAQSLPDKVRSVAE